MGIKLHLVKERVPENVWTYFKTTTQTFKAMADLNTKHGNFCVAINKLKTAKGEVKELCWVSAY